MRDQKRIKPMMDRLTKMWENYPDLRFWQFMIIVENKIKSALGRGPEADLFSVEDDDMNKALDYVEKSFDVNKDV